MGCDMYFFAEHRKDSSSSWEFLPAPPTGYEYGGTLDRVSGPMYRYGICDTSKPNYKPGYDSYGFLRKWFDDRNYKLFSMLADVRNSSEIPPILPGYIRDEEGNPHTRGWPEDCCPELQDEREHAPHSRNWLTIREMRDYFDKMRAGEIVLSGCVSGPMYEAYNDFGKAPGSWAGAIGGEKCTTVERGIYDELRRAGKLTYGKGTFGDSAAFIHGTEISVNMKWVVEFAGYTEAFEKCLTEMQEASGREPENIRAVFYFDS